MEFCCSRLAPWLCPRPSGGSQPGAASQVATHDESSWCIQPEVGWELPCSRMEQGKHRPAGRHKY